MVQWWTQESMENGPVFRKFHYTVNTRGFFFSWDNSFDSSARTVGSNLCHPMLTNINLINLTSLIPSEWASWLWGRGEGDASNITPETDLPLVFEGGLEVPFVWSRDHWTRTGKSMRQVYLEVSLKSRLGRSNRLLDVCGARERRWGTVWTWDKMFWATKHFSFVGTVWADIF
jgi:hypothetical protein